MFEKSKLKFTGTGKGSDTMASYIWHFLRDLEVLYGKIKGIGEQMKKAY